MAAEEEVSLERTGTEKADQKTKWIALKILFALPSILFTAKLRAHSIYLLLERVLEDFWLVGLGTTALTIIILNLIFIIYRCNDQYATRYYI